MGVVSLRSSLLLTLRPAGDTGDEVQRSCGEKLEVRSFQRAQRRCKAGNGEPLAQQSNRGLVLVIGIPRRCNLQTRIAEETMDGFAHQLADFEVVDKTEIAVGR